MDVKEAIERGKKFEDMWEGLYNFIMMATFPYSVAKEMRNIERRYFPKTKESKE